MPNLCSVCGAIYPDDRTCQSVFDEFLVLEFTHPDYGAVHMLTVASYMIQHGLYTDEALTWMEARLRDYLEKGIPVDEIRKQAGKGADQSQRTWKVTRRPGDRPQAKIAWSMTIMDVVEDAQDAESYCKSVKQWARATLREMKPLVHSPED